MHYKKSNEISIYPPLRYKAGGGGAAPELVSSKADGWLASGTVPAEWEQFFGQV